MDRTITCANRFLETDSHLGFVAGSYPEIWDANKIDSPVEGTVSFVFMCKDLDRTCKELAQKGMSAPRPIRYEWGTYELRLRDPDGNEVVVVERF